jgi:acyl-CoA synthetase (AMP-forming)/AMP-acid ligase II/acyl carrier protein
MTTAALPYALFVELLSDALMIEPEMVTPEAMLVEELGLQSIDVVQLVEQVENELDTDLDGLDLSEVETVEELYWELVAGGDDGGDSIVAAMAQTAGEAEALPHIAAMRAWLPDDPLADVETLVGVLARRAAITPDRVAFHTDGRDTTYRELARQVAQVASALQRHGVGRGDRVVLVLPNGGGFFAAFYAVLHLRAVAVPMYHVPQPDRIARIVNHCGAHIVVTPRPLARPVRRRLEARFEGPAPTMVDLPGLLAPERFEGEAPALLDLPTLLTEPSRAGVQLPQPEPDDLAMLQYTSGTTGDAKGVMLTHQALVANLRQAIPKARFTRDDVFVSWLPVYHDMGLITMTMCPFYLGAKLVLLPVQLSAPAWLEAIETHRGTVTAAPDFAYRYVLRVGGDLGRYDCESMRMALVAAEPVRARTIARFEAALGIPGVLRPGYGLAESCVAVTFFPLDRPDIEADADGMVCVGDPVPGTVLSIRDASGAVLPAGERGEICLRSPSQTVGYFRNPDATATLFTDDGAVRTGDVGYLDEQGLLTIVDRQKNIIIVSGRNLSPKELEEVADRMDGVERCMAVGLDQGGDSGEQVHMVVEVADPAAADRGLGRAVRATLQEHMGVRVQRVHVVPANTIPRTYNGKFQYPTMRARLEASGSALA